MTFGGMNEPSRAYAKAESSSRAYAKAASVRPATQLGRASPLVNTQYLSYTCNSHKLSAITIISEMEASWTCNKNGTVPYFAMRVSISYDDLSDNIVMRNKTNTVVGIITDDYFDTVYKALGSAPLDNMVHSRYTFTPREPDRVRKFVPFAFRSVQDKHNLGDASPGILPPEEPQGEIEMQFLPHENSLETSERATTLQQKTATMIDNVIQLVRENQISVDPETSADSELLQRHQRLESPESEVDDNDVEIGEPECSEELGVLNEDRESDVEDYETDHEDAEMSTPLAAAPGAAFDQQLSAPPDPLQPDEVNQWPGDTGEPTKPPFAFPEGYRDAYNPKVELPLHPFYAGLAVVATLRRFFLAS
ncbi:hypothetical protein K440DRAFT_665062 [Wilcoxina mikolae CBS 423.85]|nr:hypothetical protein K440DRAFT_665062 [Wilcoxina mikolae CBS 423.85]